MKLIGIQSGHKNITSNIDPTLATETGASGEMEFNWEVTLALSTILISYGFQVQIDDANANNNPNTTNKDFDLYLAVHAEGAPAGGNVVAPDPSVDASNAESNRIVNAIKEAYFSDTGIANNGIVTNNETFYYMWNLLTAKTPCGIIECGDLQDPHDSVILADHKRVALGIAHGICNAFGVEWKGDPTSPINPTPPTDPCENIRLELEQAKSKIQDLQKQLESLSSQSDVTTNSTNTNSVLSETNSSNISSEQPNQDVYGEAKQHVDYLIEFFLHLVGKNKS